VDELLELLDQRGQGLYMGEAVTELEHALQAAQWATAAGAPETAVLAALLHDVGHLLPEQAEEAAERGIDARHEAAGFAYLSPYFSPEIVDPVRLHVAAKRYLCAVEPAYQAGLSPASRRSLDLQGGPMNAAEVAAFEQEPHFQVAVACRRWDDAAKVPGLSVPALETYRPLLARHCRSQG
jgi:phosphonate degradation associated HDIG domain protein